MLLHGIKNLCCRQPCIRRRSGKIKTSEGPSWFAPGSARWTSCFISPSPRRPPPVWAEREATYAELRKRYAEALCSRSRRRPSPGIKAGISSQRDMPLLVKELVQTAREAEAVQAAVSYDIPLPGGGGLTMLSFSFPAEGAYPGGEAEPFTRSKHRTGSWASRPQTGWGPGESKAPVEARDVYQGQ